MLTNFTPYSTARPLMGALPGWLREADAERIMAYQLYDQMYWNAPDTYSVMLRGSNSSPIYIPAPKMIVEACNRFLGINMDFVVDPASGTPADRVLVNSMFRRLFSREKFYAKFNSQKRFGLVRGDAVWHIVADPKKPQGSRISMYEVDPGSYFPIYDLDNPEKITGCHIVDQHIDETTANKVVIRRQTYRKQDDGTITTALAYFETGQWDDRTWGGNVLPRIKLVREIVKETALPPQITALPVYHIKNTRQPADPFGSSEFRGVERLAAAVNQSASDEELSLALAGLGVYATTAGPPRDENDNETNWQLGPGQVVEIGAGDTFNRITGISSVQPYQDHINMLLDNLRQSVGVGETAAGRVNVSVAMSGIALRLEMAPLLSSNAEKEVEMLGTYDHMFWDITNGWFPAYEGLNPGGVIVGSVVGDPLPVDRSSKINELIQLVTAQLIPAEFARLELIKLGYDIPADAANTILEEQTAITMALGNDPFMERLRAEGLAANGSPGSSGTAAGSPAGAGAITGGGAGT